MQRATLGKSGSEAASQLQGRIARAFSSNNFVRETCKKTFSVAKSICESSLIQCEIVTGQSIQHLHLRV